MNYFKTYNNETKKKKNIHTQCIKKNSKMQYNNQNHKAKYFFESKRRVANFVKYKLILFMLQNTISKKTQIESKLFICTIKILIINQIKYFSDDQNFIF